MSKLFSNYDPTERPVEFDNENLNVSVGISIQQIVELVKYLFIYFLFYICHHLYSIKLLLFKDEKQQMLVFSGWLDMVIIN